MLQKMEEERLRQEERDRQKAEQELRMREAQAARVPDSYSTYRRPGPRQHVYDVDDDSSSYFVPGPSQPSGFADFSGKGNTFGKAVRYSGFKIKFLFLYCQAHSVMSNLAGNLTEKS